MPHLGLPLVGVVEEQQNEQLGTEQEIKQKEVRIAELEAEAQKALEQRRQALVSAFTGGDAGIKQSLTRMWKEQGDKMAAQFGYDPKLLAYLGKVVEAGKRSS